MTTDDRDSDIDDLELALGLRRLADSAVVPPVDPAREAALMAAFDSRPRRSRGAEYWGMAGLAAAAALLILVLPSSTGRHVPYGLRGTPEPLPSSSRGVQFVPLPGEFVIVPGAAALPDMESGSLVRVDLSVAVLPSLGVTPRGGQGEKVTADLIVGQDGLTRAVRLVN